MSAASDAGSQRRSDMHRPKFGNIASADPASTGGDRVSSRFGRGRAAPMKRQSAASFAVSRPTARRCQQ
ncbi:hypothetical protein ACM42_28695 [Bradyrhizobium sp. CCBAU 25338]|nr:hypothetical protein [Bradyrhizobium sp. CCBAU 25338]